MITLQDDLCNVVLEAYVEDLIQDNHKVLVSHYVAALPHDAQVLWYAKFLEGKELLYSLLSLNFIKLCK